MVYIDEVYEDLEEIVIRVSTFGQYVPVTISYKRDNFILESNNKNLDKEKILDFITNNFYKIMVLNNKKLFLLKDSGNLMFGTEDNKGLPIIRFNGQDSEIRFFINTCGKIIVSISYLHFTVKDIINKMDITKDAICDKNYEGILIKEIMEKEL